MRALILLAITGLIVTACASAPVGEKSKCFGQAGLAMVSGSQSDCEFSDL